MAINHLSALKKHTSAFLHDLTIVSTVCGGGSLSQVALGNEY